MDQRTLPRLPPRPPRRAPSFVGRAIGRAAAAGDPLLRLGASLPALYLAAGVAVVAASLAFALRVEFAGVALLLAAGVAAAARRRAAEAPALPAWLADRVLPAVAVLALALAALAVDRQAHVRNPAFFAFFALAAMAIGAQVALGEAHRAAPRVLAQLALLSIVHSASVFWLYPGYFGVDPWFHARQSEALATRGFVPAGNNYSSFPGMHTLVASAMVLGGLPVKSAYFVVPMVLALAPALAYLAGRTLLPDRAALGGAFFLALSNFFLYWGFWVSSNTLGAFLVAACLVGFLRLLREPSPLWVAAFGLGFAALLLTHALSTLVLLALAATATAAWAMLQPARLHLRAPAGVLAAAAGATLTYWAVGATVNNQSTLGWFLFSVSRIPTVDFGSLTRVTRAPEMDVGTALLVNLALVAIVGLVLAGAAIALRDRDRRAGTIALPAMALLGLIFASVIVGAKFVLPHRWFVFVFLFGTPLAAVAVARLAATPRAALAAPVLAAGLLAAALPLNAWSNPDSPLLETPTWDRYGYTEPEMAAARFARGHGIAFGTDFWFVSAAGATGGSATWSAFHGHPGVLPEGVHPPPPALLLRDYVFTRALTLPIEGGYFVTEHVEARPLADQLARRADAVYDDGHARLWVFRSVQVETGTGAPT